MITGPDCVPAGGDAVEQKRFASALLDSEIETYRDGVLLIPMTGSSLRYNDAFARLWDLPAEVNAAATVDGILKVVLSRLTTPEVLLTQVRRFRAHPETAVQCEVELKSGSVVECYSGSLQGLPGEYLGRLWFFRDVTGWRHALAALEDSHELLAVTERIAHVGGWRFDVEAGSLSWSDECYRIFGHEPRAFTPTFPDFLAAIHQDDRERIRAAVDASVTSHAPYDQELRIVRPDGTVRWIRATAEVRLDAAGKVVTMAGSCHDITEQRQAEARLRVANALSAAQLEASPDGILVVGADRSIVSYNERFIELWGVPQEVVASRSDERAVASVIQQLQDPEGFQERLAYLFAHPAEVEHDEVALKDGRVFERHSSPLLVDDAVSGGRIFFFRDISARKAAESRVAHLAAHDALTGLLNRRAFTSAISRYIEQARHGGTTFALAYLDLDHFKDVNDTLGHTAGDQLLRQVASRLQGSVRVTDMVARFGGDEFAILQTGVKDSSEAAGLAARLLRALDGEFLVQGRPVHSGASIGLTIHAPNGANAESMLTQADLALYRAKAEGRGTYRFFVESMDEEVRQRVALAADLREGIAAGQLFLVYQPQVETGSGRIIGVEALARWQHPTRGLVSPGVFIPVAEKTGLIPALGEWVTREACRQARQWLELGIAPPTVAVNVSALQFKTPLELEAMLTSALEDSGLPPTRLEIELTESAVMEAWSSQSDLLARLRQSGVQVAIDDFGTGFSSLEYLSRFPVDRIKIAQTFVIDLPGRAGSAAVVKATLGLARELGLRVIAEGVETEEQLELLSAWGCGEVQGYFLSRPVGAAAVTELLRRGVIGAGRARLQGLEKSASSAASNSSTLTGFVR